ncbi:X-ray repair cross-complementing protein 6-like [Hyalella azteca]|uniref:ATP-dependent DNA helicase 2 subunit 1 n=1 Tax=Hyalella azteca TaxID=294128 RepID=A0A8B7NIC0_HYAAZ|nr:X-ray repair cross-complementing protein 6-like [Hyalella azteca]
MENIDFNFGLDGENGEEDAEEQWQWEGRNATVFLIDVAPAMFEKDAAEEESDIPFIVAMKCVHASVCRQVVSSDQDLTAVVFFNTLNCTSASQQPSTSSTALLATFPHVAIPLPLDRPSADRVLTLESYLQDGRSKVTREFGGICEDASLGDALWASSNLITQCKSSLSGQNVLLFTCRDEPHSSNAVDLAKKAKCKARDLDDAGIDLELLGLGANFDASKFYKALITLDGQAPDRSIAGASSARLEQLQERVRRLEHKQRATGRVPFTLATGLEISVGFYTSISTARKPASVKLHRSGNDLIKTITKEYREDTGELLMTSDFCKYQEYGKRKIKFTVEESRELNKVYPTGIELLGFKPSSAIKAFHYVKPASFLYPDDKNIKGSTAAFAALLTRCVARDVVPIVRVVPRTNASPSWAALLPQEEVLDDDGCQLRAPGFHVCYLPFADDFRQLDMTVGRARASNEQVDAAKSFIKKLHFRYDPSSFENPDLQTHWRNIEALALNRRDLEPVTDYTVPDYARIRKKTQELVSAFKDLVWPSGYDATAAAAKRPPPKPRATAGIAPAAAGTPSVEDMARNNTVEKLNVATLKEWLSARNIKVTGKKKPQLVQDVYDVLSA